MLFNNAGINAPAVPMEDLSYEQWSDVVSVNLTGAFLCAQEAIRRMKSQQPQGGRIINNGSISRACPGAFLRRSRPPNHYRSLASSESISLMIAVRPQLLLAWSNPDIGNAGPGMAGIAGGSLQPNGDVVAEPRMDLDPVAQAVLYMASLPLSANVQFITVMATNMPFIGRG